MRHNAKHVPRNNTSRYYDYNVGDPYRQAGLSGDCAAAAALGATRFSPMNWCLSGMQTPVPDYVNTTYFMGFNEFVSD
jgi:hypothetical protein